MSQEPVAWRYIPSKAWGAYVLTDDKERAQLARDNGCTVYPLFLASAPDEWQPIETAPNGRKLIVGYPNQLGNWRTVLARYYLPGTLPLHDDHDWEADSDGYAEEGWYEETETHEVIMPLECEPTHWMPLPAPPTSVEPPCVKEK